MHITSDVPLDVNKYPAIQAEAPWNGVSSKYTFLSTGEVVKALGREGIYPYSVKTSRPSAQFAKHMVRFRQHDAKQINGFYPEVVVSNSHNTTSAFGIDAGVFKWLCLNGLVVKSADFGSFRVRHIHTRLDDVMDAVYGIIEQFPRVIDSVEQFQRVQLSIEQQEEYAKLAMGLRWPDADKVPFESARLLSYRRTEDKGTDLWSIFNVVQENLTQGQDVSARARGTRPITSVAKDLSINRELWELTEEFAKV